MKKNKYMFFVLIFLLVGCNNNSKLEIVESINSNNFYYTLNLINKSDLKTIKSNGEFLSVEVLIEPKNELIYKEVNVEVIFTKEIKELLVDGIYNNFETSKSLIIDKNEVYNKVSLSRVFSVSSLDNIEKINKILKEKGLEVLVTWRGGEEKVLIKS